jgi:hypothetical protein
MDGSLFEDFLATVFEEAPDDFELVGRLSTEPDALLK